MISEISLKNELKPDFSLKDSHTRNLNLEPSLPGDTQLSPSLPGDTQLSPSLPGLTQLEDFKNRELNILDLFSGSGSWVEGWRKSTTYNVNIDSVDIIKKPHINYCMDARDFKPDKKYDIVYASPPCTHFSKMRNINKLKTTEQEFNTALELADLSFKYGKNASLCYIIENPHTGKMKDFFEGCQIVDYSEYGFPMRKRTAIWSNINLKLKVKTEFKFNDLPLQYIKENSKIPKKLVDRIKWMIIKHMIKERNK